MGNLEDLKARENFDMASIMTPQDKEISNRDEVTPSGLVSVTAKQIRIRP